jgi:hypothetical protein
MLVSGLMMFICMAAGEIFFDRQLFNGFLGRPSIWYRIFLESAIATLPVCLFGLLILNRFQFNSRKAFLWAASAVWASLSLLVVLLYKLFDWPRDWHFTLLDPGLIFGWFVPCLLILASFIWFSIGLYNDSLSRSS